MHDQSLLKLLAEHRALGSAPATEHEWLAAHGIHRLCAVGDVLARKGEMAQSLLVIFSGNLTIRVSGPGSHKITGVRGGEVSGLLPFSRGTYAPNDVVVEEATELLDIGHPHFAELIRECPTVTGILVHAMVDRARQFKADERHEEKLTSLGRLAAGLAHELNNPAAAAARSAKRLAESLRVAQSAAAALGAARLPNEQRSALERFRSLCDAASGTAALSAVLSADREDVICEWLDAHGADELCAAPLTAAGITPEALDELAATVDAQALGLCLRSVAAACEVRTLTTEIESATGRISELVGAVKGFTFMDRAHAPEPVDIRRGIGDTFKILASKSRAKRAEIVIQIADDVPPAHAVGAELNQVWQHLIDNALDAIPAGGRVSVTGAFEHGFIVVRISDDGPGIPRDIAERIFDPFFTTKPLGQGTGLGLDLTRRIIQLHDGEIEVESQPGHTLFTVRLRAAL